MDATDDGRLVMRTRSERGYDRLALFYRPIERLVFGNNLQAARTALIDRLPEWKRLLILGDGDGRLLEAILLSGSTDDDFERSITSVDQSSQMLRRQQTRADESPAKRSLTLVHANALTYQPEQGAFDVIVTPFFLDCFSNAELRVAMPLWVAGLQRDGVWYHVDFVLPDRGWRRVRARFLSRAMHVFFGVMTGLRNRELVDLHPLFVDLGFERTQNILSPDGMIASSIYRRRSEKVVQRAKSV